MKIYITTAAIVVLFAVLTVFFSENISYQVLQDELKVAATDAADAALLYYDEQSYAEGIKVFKRDEGMRAAEQVLKDSKVINDDFSVKESKYVSGIVEYDVYFFDEAGNSYLYENGILSSVGTFEFPYTFTEPRLGHSEIINDATVVVVLDAGEFDYSLPVLPDPKAIRMSAYEYVGAK